MCSKHGREIPNPKEASEIYKEAVALQNIRERQLKEQREKDGYVNILEDSMR